MRGEARSGAWLRESLAHADRVSLREQVCPWPEGGRCGKEPCYVMSPRLDRVHTTRRMDLPVDELPEELTPHARDRLAVHAAEFVDDLVKEATRIEGARTNSGTTPEVTGSTIDLALTALNLPRKRGPWWLAKGGHVLANFLFAVIPSLFVGLHEPHIYVKVALVVALMGTAILATFMIMDD